MTLSVTVSRLTEYRVARCRKERSLRDGLDLDLEGEGAVVPPRRGDEEGDDSGEGEGESSGEDE